MKKAAALWALAGLLAMSTAHGEEIQISQLHGMSLTDMLEVDISTGTNKFLHQAPAVAYIVTAEEIARLGARNLMDVLESIPGLNVFLYQGIVNSPILDMRGSYSNRGGDVLFLRDGKPLRLISNGTMPEIFQLPVHFVERIEVVRGPVSAIYGADAVAGAVNIITRLQPDEAGVRVGSSSGRDAWIGRNGVAGPFEWAAAVSYSHNVDEMATRNIALHSTYTQEFRHDYGDIDLKLRSGGFTASFWALNYGKAEHGDPLNPIGGATVDTQHRHLDLGYASDLTPTTQLKTSLVQTEFIGLVNGELHDNALVYGYGGEEHTNLDLTLTESRFAQHRLRLNAGAMRERRVIYMPTLLVPAPPPPPPPGSPPPPPPPPAALPTSDHRLVTYFSAQDEFAFATDWELTLGIRADRYGDTGTAHNPRLGLVWNLNPQLTAKLLHGEAFRAPVLGDSTSTIASTEQVRNTELAFDYRPNESWRALWSLYRYHADNVADFVAPGTPAVSRDGDGSELEVSWLANSELRLNTTLSYVSVNDSLTGSRVPLTPRTSAKIALDWRPSGQWSANLRWEGYWDRIRGANDPRPPLQDFQVTQLSVRHEFDAHSTLMFTAHNLFNSRAYVPVLIGGNSTDFQLPSRSLSLQLEYRF